MIDDTFAVGKQMKLIIFKTESLACKFLGATMLVYWSKKDYFALVWDLEPSSNRTKVVADEIGEVEATYVINQLNVN